LHGKKVGIVGIKRRIEIFLDGGKVNTVVFDPRMVSRYPQSQSGEKQKKNKVPGFDMAFAGWRH
jgi:hypothetical protein